MADDFITKSQVETWFTEVEVAAQSQLVNTRLDETEVREKLYHLYQAVQVLKARFYQDFSSIYERPNNMYDEES